MNKQKPCEYDYPNCQKLATISHYLPHSNFTKDSWTCANCWAVICQPEIN